MKRLSVVVALVILAASLALAQTDKPLLVRQPTVSRTHVVFVFADDLWIVAREGGDARRLTIGVGIESSPVFSPDGSLVAFTGNYDGNTDVFVVAAAGDVPRRLTYHPGADTAAGWTPDGKRVLFRSARNSYSARFTRLFAVLVGGGFPTAVPLPIAIDGSYSPDGSQIAYVPLPGAYQVWKRYRGGMTSAIWLADLSDSSIEKLPREDWNDFNPMWVGDKIYFLSDRTGRVTLFAYDTKTKQVRRVIRNRGLDIKWAAAGPDVIVYEQFGSLHLYDLASGRTRRLDIRVAGDLASVRPRYVKGAEKIVSAALSPRGKRAVFEARGEILTVPAEKGDIRNLTETSGVAERDPAWSPDGKWIAYFSDESGEYVLHLKEQSGLGETRKINLGNPPSFFYQPVWSPDSKKIAYTDKRLNVWYLEVESGQPVLVDTNTYDSPFRSLDPAWSPDSQWLAYTKELRSHLHAVFVYSLETGEKNQVTDGMSDARFAAFDRDAKYLYFTASTDAGPTTGWLDMSSVNRPVTRSVYLVVLPKDEPSPLAPESDEEEVKEEKKEEEKEAAEGEKGDKEKKEKEGVSVHIDFENIDQRILALPIPARNYTGLVAGKAGTVWLLAGPQIPQFFGPLQQTLHQFDLKTRKTKKILEGISTFVLSQDGEKMLYRKGKQWAIVATAKPPKPGEGTLKLDKMELRVDPRAEWRQMYHEVWRIERDFLYDPGAHGLDLKAAERSYAGYLNNLGSRTDLNYLLAEMLGNLVLGHTFVGGGDTPEVKRVPGGLLGADYVIENGRYRFARVYHGENWNPRLRAPLTQPGVNVQAGEYLLVVNGRAVRGSDNIYRFFENTAGKQVMLKVGPNPDGTEARRVTVVPVRSETSLRHRAWIDGNRRKVEEMSGGRVGYVYLPNTGGGGYTNFNRYYFAQLGKQAMVVDERFNGGGLAADYIVDYMRRPLMNYWTTREGEDFTTPLGSIFGPKVMIINEFAGSGGDALPWYFRRAGVGKLVGKRTWGGLVGIYDYPQLIDGGFVTAPRLAFWNPDGTWDVENHGVTPDIEVEFDPKAWHAGRDPQLEKAVEVVLEELRQKPPPVHKKPAYPNYHRGSRRR
ncbi:MAG: PDZ domain-containing protein [Terriglobia bacterium]